MEKIQWPVIATGLLIGIAIGLLLTYIFTGHAWPFF